MEKVLNSVQEMQTFAKNSEEGLMKGLSWVEGEVKKFVYAFSKICIRVLKSF